MFAASESLSSFKMYRVSYMVFVFFFLYKISFRSQQNNNEKSEKENIIQYTHAMIRNCNERRTLIFHFTPRLIIKLPCLSIYFLSPFKRSDGQREANDPDEESHSVISGIVNPRVGLPRNFFS